MVGRIILCASTSYIPTYYYDFNPGPTAMIVDCKTQKIEIHAALQLRLKQGDTWYE